MEWIIDPESGVDSEDDKKADHDRLVDSEDDKKADLAVKAYLRKVENFRKKMYTSSTVLEIELSGYKVIGFLMDSFCAAVHPARTGMNEKAWQLLPKPIQAAIEDVFHGTSKRDIPTYRQLKTAFLHIGLFVSCMTDDYAMEKFRKLSGTYPVRHWVESMCMSIRAN
jgi:dGTP triphosphohydrolase